jgi:chemotaxis protein methyltransferase CheR
VQGTYENFKDDILSITGIDLNSYKERQMKRRIEALIAKYGINSYSDYVLSLKRDKVMLEEFINYITINVSEFYRNPEQWHLLEREVIPNLMERFGKELKIWSAACSTGDEPYSLAMLMSRFLPLNKIKIIATDIDKNVLQKADLGIYNVKSLKALPEDFIKKYFNKLNDKTYQIKSDIKDCVIFKQHDLLKDPYPDNCDLIVCRNVLIYFTDEAKNLIYAKFNKALKKDGLLFVGSTEQIMQPTQIGFTGYKPFFYRKI